MISILLPTRNRASQLHRLVDSIKSTAVKQPEIILYIDDDDKESEPAAKQLGLKYKIGPRITLTQCWNELLPLATGDILLQGNDDIVFRTAKWDIAVERAFAECDDRILMVHGSDGGDCNGQYGPHPFLHRRWIETVGYFIPPYFSSDYGDTWLNDVANALGRRVYIPITIEHMHHIYGKAEMDQTTRDRLLRHGTDNVAALYQDLAPKRTEDIAKLNTKLNTPCPIYDQKIKLTIMILTQPSRAEYLRRLRAYLDPQVFSHWGVVIDQRMFDGQLTLGQNRQVMREQAKGEYSCFIDDDDLIADDYIEKILPLLDGVDYVGFRLQCYVDDAQLQPTYHSLQYKTWNSDSNGHYRDLSHLNPIKTELALMASMEGGFGEDARWSEALRKLGVVKTEHYIPEAMYFYYMRTTKNDSAFVFDPKSVRFPTFPFAPQQQAYAAAVGKKKHNEYNPQNRVCPDEKCQSEAVVVFANGLRCNQCGLQFT